MEEIEIEMKAGMNGAETDERGCHDVTDQAPPRGRFPQCGPRRLWTQIDVVITGERAEARPESWRMSVVA